MEVRLPRQACLNMRLTPGLSEESTSPITASMMLHDTRRFYMIRPNSAPRKGPGLIFAQEKAKGMPTDCTYGDLLYRGLSEEFNLSPDDVSPHPWSLVRYHNPVPARHGRPRMTKIIYVFAVYIDATTGAKLRGNPREIQEVVPVEASDFLTVLPDRRCKYTGSVEACVRAVESGILVFDRWSFMLPRIAR